GAHRGSPVRWGYPGRRTCTSTSSAPGCSTPPSAPATATPTPSPTCSVGESRRGLLTLVSDNLTPREVPVSDAALAIDGRPLGRRAQQTRRRLLDATYDLLQS